MLISITTSGGLLGSGAGAKEKLIDTSQVAAAQKDELCRRFDPKALNSLAKIAGQPGGADRLTYHVLVTDAAGKKHRFDLNESSLPAEMLDLIDEF